MFQFPKHMIKIESIAHLVRGASQRDIPPNFILQILAVVNVI